jgi:hypothetical protein
MQNRERISQLGSSSAPNYYLQLTLTPAFGLRGLLFFTTGRPELLAVKNFSKKAYTKVNI